MYVGYWATVEDTGILDEIELDTLSEIEHADFVLSCIDALDTPSGVESYNDETIYDINPDAVEGNGARWEY